MKKLVRTVSEEVGFSVHELVIHFPLHSHSQVRAQHCVILGGVFAPADIGDTREWIEVRYGHYFSLSL